MPEWFHLTRLLYVASLRQLLAERRITPTTFQIANGRQQAETETGVGANGASVFASLPAWYQKELTERAADVEALAESVAGPAAITESAVEAAYLETALSQYTSVCVSTEVGPARTTGPLGAPTKAVCAPMARWAPQVAAAIARQPVGVPTGRLQYHGKTISLTVTARTTEPLASVLGSVIAGLLSPYTDAVDNLVTSHLGIEAVTVAPKYGTYENLGWTFGILPPDALSPPASVSPSTAGPARPPPPQQQFDPFS